MKVALQLGMCRELPSLPMFRPSALSNSSMYITKRIWWQRQQVDAAAHTRAPRRFPATQFVQERCMKLHGTTSFAGSTVTAGLASTGAAVASLPEGAASGLGSRAARMAVRSAA